jgi:hypothetical protein
MLRFFRRIRQRLLTDNKFSKYLLYAVGEILLVVIGILLALQVNNWNEQRKIEIAADSYRAKLRNDLAMDTLNINTLLADGDRMQRDIESYFKFFDAQEEESLDTLLNRAKGVYTNFFRYFPVNYTFEDMQNSGNSALLSEAERKALINLYNEQQFLMIIIDKAITDIKSYQHERNKYLDFDLSEKNFFEITHWDPDLLSTRKGLLSQHNVLTGFHDLVRWFKNRAVRIKELSRNCLALIDNESAK